MKTPLTDGLCALQKKDRVRLHMPGHKGRAAVDGALDFTEIPGDDNLHDAHGIIAESEQAIAEVYGAKASRLLVDGTTAGLMAAILAGASAGESVLIPDSAHKSVFSALFLGHIVPVFLETPLNETWHYPEGITAAAVAAALDAHPEVRGFVLPSPSYYGTISETRAIAEVLHAQGKWLIADEAHGAHLAFSDALPQDAVSAGADIIVQSTHKMLSGLTQSSVLHYNSRRIPPEKCDLYLRTLQSTSPSYLLMAGIEQAVAKADAQGEAIFKHIAARHDQAVLHQPRSQRITLIDGGKNAPYDKTKWVFGVADGSGLTIGETLRERFGIYLEIESPDLLLAYTGIGTTDADIDALLAAITELNGAALQGQQPKQPVLPFDKKYHQAVPLWQAVTAEKTLCDVSACAGKICADMVTPYPPGIPAILPGDRLTHAHVAYLEEALALKMHILGISAHQIAVLK